MTMSIHAQCIILNISLTEKKICLGTGCIYPPSWVAASKPHSKTLDLEFCFFLEAVERKTSYLNVITPFKMPPYLTNRIVYRLTNNTNLVSPNFPYCIRLPPPSHTLSSFQPAQCIIFHCRVTNHLEPYHQSRTLIPTYPRSI